MADASLIAAGMTVIGMIVLVYGLYLVMKLRDILETGTLKEAWDRFAALVLLFLVGYVGFLMQQLLSDFYILDATLFAATLFLFGAVFVAAVAYFTYSAFT